MTKFTIAALVVTVLFVMQVSIESCSDEFIKKMVVNVCGMSTKKRSFSNPNPLFEISFKGLLGDMERVFKHQTRNNEEADLQLKKSRRNKPKDLNVAPLQRRPIHITGLRDRMKHTRYVDENDGESVIIKREVMDELKKCCYQTCTEKDFKSICEKK